MKNSNLTVIIVVVLLILGGGVLYLMSMNKSSTPGTTMMENTTPPTNNAVMGEPSGASGAGKMQDPNAKRFTVTAKNFEFDTKEITVKKGDTVKVLLKNSEGFHDWVVDEFNAKTSQLQAGGEEEVTFTADKSGTFEYYCSVGKHRQMGMVGKLIVEE